MSWRCRLTYSSMSERLLNGDNVSSRAPSLSQQSLPSTVVTKQVERLVDGLLFDNNILPASDALADLEQLAATTRSSVVQHILNILKATHDFSKGIHSLVSIGIDGVKGCAQTLRDLADFGQERITMGEDDEDVLSSLLASDRVDEGLDNIGVIHVKVASKDTPQNTLERRQPGALDRSRHESSLNSACSSSIWSNDLLEIKLDSRGIVVLAVFMLQQRCRAVVKGGSDLGLLVHRLLKR